MPLENMNNDFEVERLIRQVTEDEDGKPKPDGLQELTKLAVRRIYGNTIVLNELKANFTKLKNEHDYQMAGGGHRSSFDGSTAEGRKIITDKWAKILYSGLGVGGLGLLIIALILLKRYGLI